MSILSRREFHDEEAAYAYVEKRIWANGPVCPHCGGVERIGKMGGKSTRIGAYKCYQCRKPFTVKIGTIFEASHVPMNLWLQAIYLMCASKKGISSNQLHRTLGVTLKTAWFMSHRIREAMRDDTLGNFGSGGGGRCCRTLTVADSHRESMRLDGVDEQAITRPLPHDELVRLQRGAREARVAVDPLPGNACLHA